MRYHLKYILDRVMSLSLVEDAVDALSQGNIVGLRHEHSVDRDLLRVLLPCEFRTKSLPQPLSLIFSWTETFGELYELSDLSGLLTQDGRAAARRFERFSLLACISYAIGPEL